MELFPGLVLDNPHLDEDWSEEIVTARLNESLWCHAASASHSEFSEPLDEVFNQLSFLLLGEKESVHVDIRFFFKEAAKEKSFHVTPQAR